MEGQRWWSISTTGVAMLWPDKSQTGKRLRVFDGRLRASTTANDKDNEVIKTYLLSCQKVNLKPQNLLQLFSFSALL
jgi:hypothetical protein